MNRRRVQRAAEIRGIYFDGIKKFRNSTVGCAYCFWSPRGYFTADTLEGVYRQIREFPILSNHKM